MNTAILLKPVKSKRQKQSLSQGEVQQLLHILRGKLGVVSFHKDMLKENASDYWEQCDKNDKFTSTNFLHFSQYHAAYKQHKQEEKKLVSLITTLKGMR